MPSDKLWNNVREGIYTERHEVFFGRANRVKSIEDGLVVFLTKEMHTGNNGVHNNIEFRRYMQRIGMKVWCEYYKKSEDKFKERYGFYAR